jgi:hypothetical protein
MSTLALLTNLHATNRSQANNANNLKKEKEMCSRMICIVKKTPLYLQAIIYIEHSLI